MADLTTPSPVRISGKILKLADWPKNDRLEWLEAAASEANIFDEAQRPKWRPSTRELFERCYGGYLMWLRETDSLDATATPASRVTKKQVASFMTARRRLGNSYRTLENYAVSLRHIMRVLAPEDDWSWMLPMIEKFKRAQPKKPMSGLPSIQELFQLGFAVMVRADAPLNGTVRDRAFGFRNGLAVAMLAARPIMRRKNLAEIEIGTNLIRDAEKYRLCFSDAQMKQKKPVSVDVPAILTPCVDRYIEVYRPAIINGKADPGNALWLSHMGGPVGAKPLGNEIGDLTKAAFGQRISPHRFRHCAGTSIAIELPTNVQIVAPILGHADFKISERFYIMADEYLAHAKHDTAMTALAK
jgi:integrase/recombinase XerD